MTHSEWEAYGDASASHQDTEINGVTYRELGSDAVNDGKLYSELPTKFEQAQERD